MGIVGIKSLVEFVRKERQVNYKSRELIAKALSMVSVEDDCIDITIELLINMSRDKAADVRRTCLISLSKLRNQENNYPGTRDLLPFFYQFLSDVSNEVRNSAIHCIINTGTQGQFILTEGLTKDKNALVRKECARGLGKIGATAFRTLLLGLHDSNKVVRTATCEIILQDISEEELINFLRYIYSKQ